MPLSLLESIQSAIETNNRDSIDRLFVDLFARQYELNAPYNRFCVAHGQTPDTVARWQDIPAVPAPAFRLYELSCSPTKDCVKVFHSSGTTASASSKHYMDAPAVRLYDHSASAGFRRALSRFDVETEQELWALLPDPAHAPHSSLSHMLQVLRADRWFWMDWVTCLEAIDDTISAGRPVTLFGPALSIVSVIDAAGGRKRRLPDGSAIIETGGFKGSRRAVSRDEFYAQISETFTVSDDRCLAEYGMCELSSQYYSHGIYGTLQGPPWLRTRIIDPRTGEDVEAGQEGLLRHFDLANWNSVIGVQTLDVAIAVPGGGFRLLGRAPDAEVRGCSLMVP